MSNLKSITDKQKEAIELLVEGRDIKTVSNNVGVSLDTLRGWENDTRYACFKNQRMNDAVNDGIRMHTTALILGLDNTHAKGRIESLNHLKSITPLPTTPEAIKRKKELEDSGYPELAEG